VSGEAATDRTETDPDVSRAAEPDSGSLAVSSVSELSHRRAIHSFVGITLLAMVTSTVSRILANMPFDPVSVPASLRAALGVATPLALAIALATVALTDERATVRVGLLFAAVFGLLGVVAPAAVLPAVVAVAAGGALALSITLGLPDSWGYRQVRRRAIAAGFALAVALSLAGATNVIGSGLVGIGTALALASLAAVGTRAERSPVAAGAGALAVGALVAVSATSPYVVGSALLVAFAVTGVPNILVALAVGGGVAAVVAGLTRREYPLAAGGALLLLAGAPVTLPRAMALLLGATLVVLDVTQAGDRSVQEVDG
jgi:hypothetical protein